MSELIDPVEAYLDELCKSFPFRLSSERMVEGYRKAYGIETTPEMFDDTTFPPGMGTAIRTARSESTLLRAELRAHLDASIAQKTAIGIDYDAAVRQAIEDFGEAKVLRKKLERELSATIQEQSRKSLKGTEPQTLGDKFLKYASSVSSCLATYAGITAKSPDEAIRWSTAIVTITAVFSFLQYHRNRAKWTQLGSMAAIFEQQEIPNPTRRQKITRAIMRLLLPRHRPTWHRIVSATMIRVTLLRLLWLVGDLGAVHSHPIFDAPGHIERLFFFIVLAEFAQTIGAWIAQAVNRPTGIEVSS